MRPVTVLGFIPVVAGPFQYQEVIMHIQLSDHFNYNRLFKFSLPSIIMMIFTSVYSVVDGFFVSNFVGKTPFAAVNFIMPFLMILGAVGFMFGTGGGAFIAKTLGEGAHQKANRYFSLFIYISFLSGIIIMIGAYFLLRPIAELLGAKGAMLDDCVLYGRIILASLPTLILQFAFQSFFITAEKPQLGLAFSIAAGITNIIGDGLFVAVFHWGLAGAAAATTLSQAIGGLLPLFYFARPNTSLLRLGKTNFDKSALLKACTNGSSELMSNLSISLVSMLYNIQLMKYAGEDGVAAYGVLMYVNMIFLATFIGYSTGTAPIISYHYGARNHMELKSLLKKSFVMIGASSICMFVIAEILAAPLSKIFAGYDQTLLALTTRAFVIYSFSFFFRELQFTVPPFLPP